MPSQPVPRRPRRIPLLRALLDTALTAPPAVAAEPAITTLQHRLRYARDQLERAEAQSRQAREAARRLDQAWTQRTR